MYVYGNSWLSCWECEKDNNIGTVQRERENDICLW